MFRTLSGFFGLRVRGAWKTMALPAKEFLRRYLQHVLPQGFHKVRYYGLLSPSNQRTLRRLQLLLAERTEGAGRAATARQESGALPPIVALVAIVEPCW